MLSLKYESKDNGDVCLDCHKNTAWGTGNFANRIPAYRDHETGYLCADCADFNEDVEAA